MPLYLKALETDIDIFGNRQSFHFNHDEVPTDNKGFYSLINHFNPTASTALQSSFDLLDKSLNGFRLFHERSLNQTHGSLALQAHSVFGTSEDIFKYDEATDKLTFYKSVEFDGGGVGTVTSVGVSGSTGLSVSGSPITSSGTIGLSLSSNLRNLASQSSSGIMSRSSGGSYLGRTITAGSGISVSNGNGISGNPTISTSNIPISSLSAYPSNSSVYLRGDGTWSNPIGLPLALYSSSSTTSITLYNSNSSANATGFKAYNQNTNRGVEFGLNNSTNEGYAWAGPTMSLKFGTNGTTRMKINNDGSVNMYANRITNLGYPSASTDATSKAYVDSVAGGASFASNDINVNTNGGTNNWLRRANVTRTGVTIYGLSSSTSSFLLESNSGESAGIGVNGSSDACTIWTAGDSGSYLNIQDEDSSNTRQAYVNTSGSWIQVSSRARKHSIKDKVNNNVLDRFLQLSVKSYGYKYSVSEDASKKALSRINKKTNKMQIGLILEELFEVFPNCIPDYYNSLFKDKSSKENLNLKEEIQDISNSGIDYNVLLCYFIMAFQEYINKNNKEIAQLKTLLKKENKK